jgi:TRAP-type uncharacterized transport system substrate-binding protein
VITLTSHLSSRSFGRPATLRIAIGPPGSEDVSVIQEVAQAFTRERHYVRLQMIVTASAAESAMALGRNEVDLAVVRADLNLPKDAMTVAVFRKNVVVLWVPNSAQPKGQKKDIKKIGDLSGRRLGVVGKTQANVDLLKLVLTESGVSSDKVEILQFGTTDWRCAGTNNSVSSVAALGVRAVIIAKVEPGSTWLPRQTGHNGTCSATGHGLEYHWSNGGHALRIATARFCPKTLRRRGVYSTGFTAWKVSGH